MDSSCVLNQGEPAGMGPMSFLRNPSYARKYTPNAGQSRMHVAVKPCKPSPTHQCAASISRQPSPTKTIGARAAQDQDYWDTGRTRPGLLGHGAHKTRTIGTRGAPGRGPGCRACERCRGQWTVRSRSRLSLGQPWVQRWTADEICHVRAFTLQGQPSTVQGQPSTVQGQPSTVQGQLSIGEIMVRRGLNVQAM